MSLSRRTAFRTSIAPIAATALAAVAAPAAFAGEAWCDVDPVQLVVTSGGKIVPIFVTNGAPSLVYAPQLLAAQISHKVKSVDGGKASLITVYVKVANGLLGGSFDTRTVVTSGPWGTLERYGVGYGKSGNTMTVEFKLPVG